MFKVLVVDEEYNVEYVAGKLDKKAINILCEVAQKHKLRCLNFLSIEQNTYFSHTQQFSLEKEVAMLKEVEPELATDIDMLTQALKIARADDFSQLKVQLMQI